MIVTINVQGIPEALWRVAKATAEVLREEAAVASSAEARATLEDVARRLEAGQVLGDEHGG